MRIVEAARETPDTPQHERRVYALAGQTLYGDDFSPSEIEKWFAGEREACLCGAIATTPTPFRVSCARPQSPLSWPRCRAVTVVSLERVAARRGLGSTLLSPL